MKKIILLLVFVSMVSSVSAIMPASQDIMCCYDAQDEEGNINETQLSTDECSEFELDKGKCLAIIREGKDYLDVTYGENPCSTETECLEFCESNDVNEAECFGMLQNLAVEEKHSGKIYILLITIIILAFVFILWYIFTKKRR